MTENDASHSLPRSVLVASDQSYKEILTDPNAVARLRDREALVIPYSAKPEVNEEQVESLRSLLREAGQLASGALLIKNPYEAEGYVSANDAIETFAVAKYHHLAVVASLLGAREVRVVEAKVERKSSESRGNAKAGVKGVGVEADASAKFADELEAQLHLETDFAGSDPHSEDALAYIRAHNLAGEHALTTLVSMRSGKNPVERYKMTLSGTKESELNIKSALKIATAIPKAVELGGDFSRTAGSISSIKITTEIKFPETEPR